MPLDIVSNGPSVRSFDWQKVRFSQIRRSPTHVWVDLHHRLVPYLESDVFLYGQVILEILTSTPQGVAWYDGQPWNTVWSINYYYYYVRTEILVGKSRRQYILMAMTLMTTNQQLLSEYKHFRVDRKTKGQKFWQKRKGLLEFKFPGFSVVNLQTTRNFNCSKLQLQASKKSKMFYIHTHFIVMTTIHISTF
jgi:hypothetical protein